MRSLSDDFPLEQNQCWCTLLSLGDKVISGREILNKLQCFTSLQCLWSFAGNKKQLFNRMTVFTECETLKNLKVLWVGLERAGPNAPSAQPGFDPMPSSCPDLCPPML